MAKLTIYMSLVVWLLSDMLWNVSAEKLTFSSRSSTNNEVFIFSTTNKNYRLYDWSKITTFIQSGYHDNDLVNYAHSKNVNVGYLENFATSMLRNATQIDSWIAKQVAYILSHNLDAINIDYEDELLLNDTVARQGLTSLLQKLNARVKSVVKSTFQVTMDFGWHPDCPDNRCYDYKALADAADFVFVMDYDTRSQIPYDCIAWANSPVNNTVIGLSRFLQLGIPAAKLVLGVPWYGYNYQCIRYNKTDDRCDIKPIPFRGGQCSDAVGTQQGYSYLMHLMKSSKTKCLWDSVSMTPYFTYQDADGSMHQVWFDDVKSLSLKYNMAADLGARGVGMWEADSLDYSDTPEMRQYVADMWGTLP